MMKRLAGFLLVVFGLVLAGWVAYNLFIERLPETKGQNPLPAIVNSLLFLWVGWGWMHGRSVGAIRKPRA